MWQNLKNIYHLIVAIAANIIYLFPGRSLRIIGVTGTDGKTTTSTLIYHILNSSGKRAALFTSIAAFIGNESIDTGFHRTTPISLTLQALLKKAKKKNMDIVVLEVTSHALHQNRVLGVPFEFGVLTNITNEHLDYHKTYKNYVDAKKKLLIKAKIAIVNRDDNSFKFFADLEKKKGKNFITYGLDKNSDFNPDNFKFETNLIGDFNKYNCLAAIAVCRKIGISDTDIKASLKTFKNPEGRMDVVFDNDFRVMIDFAHTPNAIRQILKSIRPGVEGRLIHVFGSAGERDTKKRPEMGRASSEYSDVIILTAEDPRSERVEEISKQIQEGIPGNMKVESISDRRVAIKKAIEIAREDDLVIITGKGHEKSMNYGKGEEPWSEHDEVRKAVVEKDG